VSPQMDATGNIDSWPDGFFDQFDKDMNHFAGWD
jgi:predicted ATPase